MKEKKKEKKGERTGGDIQSNEGEEDLGRFDKEKNEHGTTGMAAANPIKRKKDRVVGQGSGTQKNGSAKSGRITWVLMQRGGIPSNSGTAPKLVDRKKRGRLEGGSLVTITSTLRMRERGSDRMKWEAIKDGGSRTILALQVNGGDNKRPEGKGDVRKKVHT